MKASYYKISFVAVAVFLMAFMTGTGVLQWMYVRSKPVAGVIGSKCPSAHIDTIYNYIDEPEPHPYTADALRVPVEDLFRDSKGCLVNQEVCIWVFWNPITNHSEL